MIVFLTNDAKKFRGLHMKKESYISDFSQKLTRNEV